MNKLKNLTVFILLFATAFFSSCTTEVEPYEGTIPNPNTGGNTSTNGIFKVDFDGQTFTANQVVAIKQSLPSPAGNLISYSISGNLNTATGAKAVVVQFFENASNNYELTTVPSANTGTGMISYISDSAHPDTTTFISTNTGDPFTNQGHIHVSSNNATTKIISGTFDAHVYLIDANTQQVIGTKVFTNGVFTNVHYTGQ